MPDIRFLLRNPETPPQIVWVCGFEPGREELIRELRVEHPDAFLVVTARGPTDDWAHEVREAGADYACGWPVPVEELSRILHSKRRVDTRT